MPANSVLAHLVVFTVVGLLLGCRVDDSPSIGSSEFAIIECNGDSVGQICDTDNEPCTQELCTRVGNDVSCQLQQFAPDGSVCLSDGLSCTADSCQQGKCVHTPLPSGTLCDDGLFCTSGDTCNAGGVCGGGMANCDDRNECTADLCDEGKDECTNTVRSNAPCDDNDICTDISSCGLDGVCRGGTKIDCDDGLQCTRDRCDPITGCVSVADPGASCRDDLFCTTGELCQSDGSCVGVAMCDDGNVCTSDICDEQDGTCQHVIRFGGLCDDDNECTELDSCSAAGECVGTKVENGTACGGTPSCFMRGTCQEGRCSVQSPFSDQTRCDDNDACTSGDQCTGGVCRGEVLSCDDGDLCTSDECEPAIGCTHSPIAGCEEIVDGGVSDGAPGGNSDSGPTVVPKVVLGGGGCQVAGEHECWRGSWLFVLIFVMRKRKRNRVIASGVATLLWGIGAGGYAEAQGFDSEIFRPNTSSTSFFSQGSAEVLPASTVNAGVGFHLSRSLLVLYDSESGQAIPDGVVVSQRSGAYLSAGIGLLDKYELGIVLPFVVQQTGTGEMLVGDPDLSSASLGDLRIDLKAKLWSLNSMAVAAKVSATLPTGNNDSLTGETGVTATPRLVLGLQRPPFHVGVNFGIRIRTGSEVASLSVNDEYTGGLGAEAEIVANKLWLLAEAYGNIAMHSASAESSPAEAIVGVRYAFLGPWQARLGGGFGIGRGYGSPGFRGLLSMSYAPATPEPPMRQEPPGRAASLGQPSELQLISPEEEASEDQDGDGLIDEEDRCPEEAEDMDEYQDGDGCPEFDNDGDQILDVDDDCPMEPETINGVDDSDGCPDEGAIELIYDRVVLPEKILFDKNRARVKRAGREALRAILTLYQQHPDWGIMKIEGHTSSWGPNDYNMDLSRRRAERVRAEMIRLGMQPAKIITEGFGSRRMLTKDRGERARQINRRVEFIITTIHPKNNRDAVPAVSPK